MALTRKLFIFMTSLTLIFALLACSDDGVTEAEPDDQVTATEIEEDEPVSADQETDEEEAEEDEAKNGSASTGSGSGFKHNVKIDVEGVVEKDKGEGWWDLN